MPRQPSQPMPRKPAITFTPELKAKYLEHYRANGCLRASAAEQVGVRLRCIEHHRTIDPEFRESMDEIKAQYVEQNYVTKAREYALEGVEEPIIGGKERNEIVAYKRNVSPDMLKFLIRRDDPSFREGADRRDEDGGQPVNKEAGLTGIVLPGKSVDNDTWRERYQNAAKGLKPDGSAHES